MKNDAKNESFDTQEIKELTENQEKLEKLSKKELEIIESIETWLKSHRGYRDYDFTDDFKVEKLIPLIKLVEYKEFEFTDTCIIQHLRNPIEMKNKSGDTEKRITELKYKTRYQDFELQNYTKGINVSKEPMTYIAAQIAMLTGTAKSIIGKLYDVDSNNSKLISALYFLG
jgi:hypothetical protein